ncbi:type VII secretion protein EssC [Paenibacillus turpanensis]|uniref:type VII secretion protein EssC n=1 Tax=Paenibacillus turpanensis TaxID=2689078 RepID=UPI00140D44AC|nr:type VII secretion protein EssC [Paenibacillus turpanensis]
MNNVSKWSELEPFIQRSPRIKKSVKRGTVDIHRPPNAPTKPTFSLLSLVFPLIITVGGVLAMVYFVPTKNSNQIAYQMIFMAMMMTSYILPGIMHLSAKRQYRIAVEERKRSYLKQMQLHREELEAVRRDQKAILLGNDPAPEMCLGIIKERDEALWSRSPLDEDFLHVRIGTGEVPFGITVEAPQQDGYNRDPLIEEAQQIEDDYQSVSGAPIALPLRAKVIGVVGDRTSVMNAVRALSLQLTTHHSPDEAKIGAVFSESAEKEWGWLRWVPHVWDDSRQMRFLARDAAGARMMLDYLYHALHSRKISSSGDSRKRAALPAWILLLDNWEQYEDEPLMHLLLNEAEAINSTVVLLSDSRQKLPMQCKDIVEVRLGVGTLYQTFVSEKAETLTREVTFVPDRVPADYAEEASRLMAPYRLKKSSSGDIPNVLTLFDLFGIDSIESLNPAVEWSRNRFPQSLPAPVGVRSGGKEVQLNVHDKIERKGHGPHGLIAGTTGSGKSEVIQSLIAGLALKYHPHEVAFMLIDYKGGGMSNTFEGLPHVVATITNLEGGNLIERARVSLRAELERRQRLFNEAGNLQHIDEYYRSAWREREPLPHLIIVIDEFAQLKKDHPDFMAELISIAAIGRTLGVHLILATQKPAGVVDDKIWSNARFRICLRVQDDADSKDMLKVPDAAWITTPGRGYFQVGSNEVFELVQFAWSGAPYRPGKEQSTSEEGVLEIDWSGRRRAWSTTEESSAGRVSEEASRKQLQVFIDWLRDQAKAHGIRTLPGPWLPPLPTALALEELLPADYGWHGSGWTETSQWLQPVVGLVDDLAHQRQIPLTLALDEGHFLVYGMPGTGKTTFLQTLMVSLARQHQPSDLHMYVLDFGRMHRDLAKLPHVGDILQEEDTEKMRRLFMLLNQQVNERKELLANAGVKTAKAYRAATGLRLPAIVVAIDGYVSFKTAYPDEHELLEPLLREGGNLGILFITTVNRISDIFDKIRSNFVSALSFELADTGDYYFAVGKPVKPLVDAPEGRGLVKGNVPPLEFQAALPAPGENESERTQALRSIAQTMEQSWSGQKAPAVPVLPDKIPFLPLLEEAERAGAEPLSVPVALEVDSLAPFTLKLTDGPNFLIGSRIEGGKTAFLYSCIVGLAYLNSPQNVHMYAVDFRRTPQGLQTLRSLPHMRRIADQESEMAEMLQELRNVIQNRKSMEFGLEPEGQGGTEPAIILLIDDAETVAKRISSDFDAQSDLEYILRYGKEKNVFVIAAGIAADLASCYDGWISSLKSAATGFLLGGTDSQDIQLFQLRMDYSETGKTYPPGLGYYVRRRSLKVKAVFPYDMELETVSNWGERICKKWEICPI